MDISRAVDESPLFCLFFADTKKLYTDDLVNAVVIVVSGTPINAPIEMRLNKMVVAYLR
jgi:hypothetical protein